VQKPEFPDPARACAQCSKTLTNRPSELLTLHGGIGGQRRRRPQIGNAFQHRRALVRASCALLTGIVDEAISGNAPKERGALGRALLLKSPAHQDLPRLLGCNIKQIVACCFRVASIASSLKKLQKLRVRLPPQDESIT